MSYHELLEDLQSGEEMDACNMTSGNGSHYMLEAQRHDDGTYSVMVQERGSMRFDSIAVMTACPYVRDGRRDVIAGIAECLSMPGPTILDGYASRWDEVAPTGAELSRALLEMVGSKGVDTSGIDCEVQGYEFDLYDVSLGGAASTPAEAVELCERLEDCMESILGDYGPSLPWSTGTGLYDAVWNSMPDERQERARELVAEMLNVWTTAEGKAA